MDKKTNVLINKWGYYTPGDNEIKRRYNNYSEENYSLNRKRVTYME